MKNVLTKEWFEAAAIRALKTVAETAIAAIGTSATVEGVNWEFVLSTSFLAGLLSLVVSLKGLPEIDNQ